MKKSIFTLILTAIITVCMFACNSTATAQATLYNNSDSTINGTSFTTTSATSRNLYDATTIYTMYTKVGAFTTSTLPNYLVTFNVTKVSGTGTSKVFVQGSTDGIVWRNLNTSMLGTDGFNSDTLNIAAAVTGVGVNYAYYSTDRQPVLRATLSAATNYVNHGRVFFIRLKIVGTGTQVTTFSNCKVYTYQ